MWKYMIHEFYISKPESGFEWLFLNRDPLNNWRDDKNPVVTKRETGKSITDKLSFGPMNLDRCLL